MTTAANEAYKRAANSPAAREARRDRQVDRRGRERDRERFRLGCVAPGQQAIGRARDAAVDAYDQVHEASVRNPHLTLAIALGIGFLFGIVAATKR